MRQALLRAAPLAALALAACPAHTAYGPAGDERLEASTTEKASKEGDDVAGLSCRELMTRFRDSKSDDKPEAERLKTLVEVFASAKERSEKLDTAIDRNPDLVYTADGDAIKTNQDECRSAFADIRSDLDRYVREIVDMPVIQELQGKETVNVARLDFALVRSAITTLDPDDKDALLGRIESAEKRVKKSPGK